MPFVNEKQRKLCWYLHDKDIKANKKPSWDCNEFENARTKGSKKKAVRAEENPEKIENPNILSLPFIYTY